ncbi:hypothetical protein [Agrococcus sp. HG114]|uniref:hypothetical protein n=1 Tax=Agrococcus sp. HG114 TaxID=2969757 RepID=UPI00215B4B37|nr:hypothetical protein [Agrococcus sp. HG114]MCR8671900.1 hypothetical protein [Agrococcus sp. HG114]
MSDEQPHAPGEQDPAQRTSRTPDEPVVDEGLDGAGSGTREPDPELGESIQENPAEGYDPDAPRGA